MKEPIKDDERLSAFLEGQLSGRERDEMLAHLDASDDDYEVLSDTTEVLLALEEEDARAAAPAADGVIPIRRPVRRWRMPARALALAASVAGILLISTLARRQGTSGAGDPVRLAARVDTARAGLPEGWSESRPWPSDRGEASTTDRQARAARAGAMLVDLSVAVGARDSLWTFTLAEQLRTRFDQGAGPGTALRVIAARAGTHPDSLQGLVAKAADRLAQRLGERKHLELGAWTEAASLAAVRRDTTFFGDRTSRAMLRRAARLTRDDADAQAAVKGVRTALSAEGAPRWEPLKKGLDALLAAIAS